jgi:hypothetical protein
MTMYLPNPSVRPTGYEAGEFIEPDPIITRSERPFPQSEIDTEANETDETSGQ